ncbi:hypothetical protein OAR97_00580 [Arcobacteraceae bacterium]|nr:hypothetical protein [Arcobacteraceae bacterium]
MIKKIFFLAMLTTALFSNSFNVNSNIGSFELADQFEKTHTVNSDVKTMIVSFEKDTSAGINEFLSTKEKGFLEANNTVFIADISGMPSLITSFFALPKMKKYNYNILLIYDEEEKRFLKKEERLTVYKLENGVITSVQYVEKKDIPTIF